jgi:hypothetical protein
MTRLVTTAQDLVVSSIDLTRACTENELYLAWLTTYSKGSQFVADYLCRATLAFQMQSAAETLPFDAYVARETFADLLMVSAPLSNSELARTAEKAPGSSRTPSHSSALLSSPCAESQSVIAKPSHNS